MRAQEFIKEVINTDILHPAFRHQQRIGDYTLRAKTRRPNPNRQQAALLRISCHLGKTEVGFADFEIQGPGHGRGAESRLVSDFTWVLPGHRQSGIASTMYAYAKMLGNDIAPSLEQLPAGKQMWDAWRQSGDAEHLTRTPPRAIAEATLRVDVPTEEWLQSKVDYVRGRGRDEFGAPRFGSATGYVRGDPLRVGLDTLSRLPGLRGEQHHVRADDLKWLMTYMEKTGRLPPQQNDPNKEYLPFIVVAYNGEAWVSEGNHRIMAAARLGWQAMPIEITYFDGGERVKSGPLYPGKIGL